MKPTNSNQRSNKARVYQFKLWWGLAAALLLMVVVVMVGPYSANIQFRDKAHAFWYLWQLPESTTMGFISAWVGYLLHQCSNWWLIARAKRERGVYVTGLRPINVWALALNAGFVLLHIVQSKFWYDGLAQNFSPLVAQFSVIFMLVFILIMENPRRGLFFGKAMPIKPQVTELLRNYHGYYFSWAIIFTFWFHPIELTNGHLLGVFYVLCLMLQGSLFFTAFHRDRRWTVFLECYVLLHGAVVAYYSPYQSAEMVAMFVFGFLTLFVVTQIYGLGLSKRVVALFSMAYLLTLSLYYFGRWSDMLVVVRVPFVEYGFVLVFVLIIWAGIALKDRVFQAYKE